MTEVKITPPQPVPYPGNCVLKNLYRFPILLYRLGLGKLIGKYILVLSTFGRKSGNVHRTPIEFFQQDGRIFVISGFGHQTDWFKNLLANPHVTLNTAQGVINAIARKPETSEEWQQVYTFIKSSPVTIIAEPAIISQLDDPDVQEAIKSWPVLTFDPTDKVCPPPLDADLVWSWPLILILTALNIFVGWLIQRKK